MFQKELLCLENSNSLPQLKSGFISMQSSDHIDGRGDNRGFLWNMWVLEKYLKKNLM
jgi:hypothetical protein